MVAQISGLLSGYICWESDSGLLLVFLNTVRATIIKGQEEQCKTKINKICDYYNSSEIKKDLKTEKDFKKDRILSLEHT